MLKNLSNLLIVGSVAFDDIKTPFGEVKRALGGSATYCSLAASFFAKPSVVAVVGEDFASDEEKVFTDKGIDIDGLEKVQGKTFAWGGEYSFDLNLRTSLFTHLNVFENFNPKLSEKHRAAEFVFLGNAHPVLQKKILGQIKNPKFAGLDTMNYWIEKNREDLLKTLAIVNALIINDTEARELTKQYNLQKAAKQILGLMDSPKNPVVIIKRGENGLSMFQAQNIFNLPAFPLEDVFDPTGAGDSFAGAFLGHLSKTNDLAWENLKRACVYGSVFASFCVEEMGTKRLVDISLGDIEKRFKEFKLLTHFEV